MTTITINERTKAGKALLELAKMLAVTNKGIEVEMGSTQETDILSDLDTAFKQLKQAKEGNLKRKTLDQLLNEK
jgi:uncharacterized protein YdeI (YjbR/CyaY-like superfamily)